MNRWARYACGTLLLVASGCQTGVGVMTYQQGTTPVVAKAPADGEYALYTNFGADPKVSYFLHQGDPLGFKVGHTGEIIAVAGNTELSEPDGNYVWRRRTGQEGQPGNNPLMNQSTTQH